MYEIVFRFEDNEEESIMEEWDNLEKAKERLTWFTIFVFNPYGDYFIRKKS